MISRETRRQARRPISGQVQLELAIDAFRDVLAQAQALPTSTAQQRSYADGYAQALKDFTREVEERQSTFARWRRVTPIPWLRRPADETREAHKVIDGYPCSACAKPLSLESAKRAAKLWSFSLDDPNARRFVQEFWSRPGAHTQARHAA
jgi:hypothetical protein